MLIKQSCSDKMMSILDTETIERNWYGSWGSRAIDKREIIRKGLAQINADFGIGHTLETILKSLGFIGKNRTLTK